MIISRRAHDLIVAELRNQIVELKSEREFYRKAWTKSRGQTFTKPEESISLPFEQPQLTIQPNSPDDNWTSDDRELFQQWSYGLPNGIDPMDEWKRKYGNSPPLIVLTV